MYVACWFGASTVYFEQVSCNIAKNTFSHVATTGVSSTENKNFGLMHEMRGKRNELRFNH
jgi:hypothetical protein